MMLAIYYAIVAFGYLILAAVDFHTSQVVVPFVIAMFVAPAVYGESLRVRRRRS